MRRGFVLGLLLGVSLGASGAVGVALAVTPVAVKPKPPKYARNVSSTWGDEYWKPSEKLSVNFVFGKDGPGAGGEASMQVLSADPGFVVAPHKHDASVELLYVIEGRGTLTIGGEKHPVTPGTAIWVPKGVEHSFVLDATTPLLALQIYTPGGPEERFKAPPAKKFSRTGHDEKVFDPISPGAE